MPGALLRPQRHPRRLSRRPRPRRARTALSIAVLATVASAFVLPSPALGATAYRWKTYDPTDCAHAQQGCAVVQVGDPANLTSFREFARIEPWAGVPTLGISPDGRWLTAVKSFLTNSEAYVFDTQTGMLARRLPIRLDAVFSSFRPGSTELWSGGTGPSGLAIDVLDVATGTTRRIETDLPANRTPIIGFSGDGLTAFLADGESLPPGWAPAAGSPPRSILTIDAGRHAVTHRASMPSPNGVSNYFMPDLLAGKSATRALVSGHEIEGTTWGPTRLSLVDPASGSLIHSLPVAPGRFIRAADLAPDGRFFASTGGTYPWDGGDIHIIDGETGDLDGQPLATPAPVVAFSFSPDGRYAYGHIDSPPACAVLTCVCLDAPITIDLAARRIVPCVGPATTAGTSARVRVPRRPTGATARAGAYIFKPGPGLTFRQVPRATGPRAVALRIATMAPVAVTVTVARNGKTLGRRALTLVRRQRAAIVLRLPSSLDRAALPPLSRVRVSVSARDGYGNRERLSATVRLPAR